MGRALSLCAFKRHRHPARNRPARDPAARQAGHPATKTAARDSTSPKSPSTYELYLRAGTLLEDADDPFARARQGTRALPESTRDRSRLRAGLGGPEPGAVEDLESRPDTRGSAHGRGGREPGHPSQPRAARGAGGARTDLSRNEPVRRGHSRAPKRTVVNPNWDEAELSWPRATATLDIWRRPRRVSAARLYCGPGATGMRLGKLLTRRGDYAGARTAFQQHSTSAEKNLGYKQLAALESLAGNYAAAISAHEKLHSPETNAPLASNI